MLVTLSKEAEMMLAKAFDQTPSAPIAADFKHSVGIPAVFSRDPAPGFDPETAQPA
ncbi:MAG: hypothetical protein LRZ85_07260 [Alphaproteobacteria bacterium]|nr:hypothetical protein [Alphaproteobacteria bacterium]MCD8570577.1 hypothetical protein [Alphaproteobacteria bacterium]